MIFPEREKIWPCTAREHTMEKTGIQTKVETKTVTNALFCSNVLIDLYFGNDWYFMLSLLPLLRNLNDYA